MPSHRKAPGSRCASTDAAGATEDGAEHPAARAERTSNQGALDDLLGEIVSTARQPFVALDADMMVRCANPAFLELCRVSAAEARGQSFFALGEGRWDIPPVRALLDRVLQHGDAVHDYRIEHELEGLGPRTMLANARRLSDRGFNPETLLLAIEDVTCSDAGNRARLAESLEQQVAERTADLEAEIRQRVKTRAALRASEERLRTAFRHAPAGIVEVDPRDGRLLAVNPAFCGILGYSEVELVGRTLAQITHPEDRDADREGFRRLSDGEISVYHREKRYVRKDGAIVWVEVNASLVRDAEGRPLYTVGMIADIDRRKRLERQLAERTEQLRRERNFMDAVLDTQAALVLVVDADGRVVQFNQACKAATGLDFEDMRGSSAWCQLVPEEERAAVQQQVIDRLQAGDDVVQHQNHLLCRDGTRRLILWRNTTLRDDEGRILYMIGTGVDVTEQRRVEAEAREHLEEASRLQRLQTANELATMLAHEINQPLAAIAMYAEASRQIIRQSPPDQSKLAANLERIGQQALRAGDTIRHLRAFVSRGRIDPVPIDLNAVLRGACALMAPKVGGGGIDLDLALDETLPLAMGVDVHVEQVLLNLLRNACDAIAEPRTDKGAIRVRTGRSEGMARVTVRDNGPGVDADAAAKLFEPLSSKKAHGLGVGLRISRSLIEAHGGRLWVEPQTPGGVFHFELPLAP